jgi:FAD/FMN-containing dehydrogenase
VVTAAALKLQPLLVARAVAFVALRNPADAIALLARAKAESGGALEAFELMSRAGVEFVIRHMPDRRRPLEGDYPWCALIEIASGEPGAAETAMERLLAAALEADLIQDAAIAQTEAQAQAFWTIREDQSAAQKAEGAAWKHDISVPVSRIADFIETATAAMERISPGVRVVAFGHVGDGNVHFDVVSAPGADQAAHSARRDEAARVVNDIAAGMGGSISAEHGLGAMKTLEAMRYKSQVEIDAQRAIRAALDPKRIMNPRVLF